MYWLSKTRAAEEIGSFTEISPTLYVGRCPAAYEHGRGVLWHHRLWNVFEQDSAGEVYVTGPTFSTKGEATFYAMHR